MFQFLQSSDGRLYHDGRSIVGPDTTCYYYFHTGAISAISPQFVSYLGFAKGASVLGILADFNFLHCFLEGGTIMGSGYTNSDILDAFSHVTSRSKPREEV